MSILQGACVFLLLFFIPLNLILATRNQYISWLNFAIPALAGTILFFSATSVQIG